MREEALLEKILPQEKQFTPYPGYFSLRTKEFVRVRESLPAVFRRPELAAAEIGCGLGYTTALLSLSFRSVTGIDLVQEDNVHHSPGLAKAKALSKILGLPLAFLSGSLERLPLADGSVDLLYNQYVLEHVLDYETAFREINRVLKPGGKMVSIVPNLWDRVVWIFQYYCSLNFPKDLLRRTPKAVFMGPPAHDTRRTFWEECRLYQAKSWEGIFMRNHHRILKVFRTRPVNWVYLTEKALG